MILPKARRINPVSSNAIKTWAILVLVLVFTAPGLTQTDSGTDAAAPGKELHITADRLTSDGNANYVLFSGHVTTIYDGTTIQSDQMKVFYESAEAGRDRMGEENIKKIVASGHVAIQFGDRTARCDQAVYTAGAKTIVLTGENTIIQSGTDFITGKKITIDQNKGRITVDGSPENRVNAVFSPKNSETIETGIPEDHDDTGAE